MIEVAAARVVALVLGVVSETVAEVIEDARGEMVVRMVVVAKTDSTAGTEAVVTTGAAVALVDTVEAERASDDVVKVGTADVVATDAESSEVVMTVADEEASSVVDATDVEGVTVGTGT